MVSKKKKIVYVGLSADILHKGHIDLIKFAHGYGKVIVGLLTDRAISTYKSFPHLSYEQRYEVIKNIKYVYKVIPQDTLDYSKNLKKIKPDFVAHGDDWKTGVQRSTRAKVIQTLKKWSGRLVEKKYTKNISSTFIKDKIKAAGTTPDNRRLKLKRLISAKDIVRVMEAHNPLSGLIVENLIKKASKNHFEFDAMWSSSLTDSVSRGMQDNQSVDYSTRIAGINDIFNVTTKPLIFDIDNGGNIEHLGNLVKKLDSFGVSSIILEDKIGIKKNSLFENQSGTKQDSIKNICNKIRKAQSSKLSEDFLTIIRIESFILGKNLKDAIKRAEAYIDAGCDGIMIHSKDKTPNSIFSFSKQIRKLGYDIPLVAVPSTYSNTHEKDLIKNGFNIVIYANHLLRASYQSMLKTAESILINRRASLADKNITTIKEILNLIK